MTHDKLPWFRFNPSKALAAIHGMTDAEAGKWIKRLLCDLINEDGGDNHFAKSMLDERLAFIAERSRAGMEGAKRRWLSHGSPMANDGRAMRSHSHNDTIRNETDLKPEIPPYPPFSDSDSESGKISGRETLGNLYEEIECLPAEKLAGWAVKFCNEARPVPAEFAHKRIIRLIGPSAFRSILTAFAGEVRAGEEPRNRGAAFMARLKQAVAEKAKR